MRKTFRLLITEDDGEWWSEYVLTANGVDAVEDFLNNERAVKPGLTAVLESMKTDKKESESDSHGEG